MRFYRIICTSSYGLGPMLWKLGRTKKWLKTWLKVYPGRRIDEHLGDPTREEVDRLANDRERLLEIRRRLSDVSWLMKSLSEPIARLANKQDGCTGRFWEGRFRAQRIVDEAGLLACSMYVDLNPVRAAMAQTPEQSRYTSAYDRIKAGKGEEQVSAASEAAPAVSAKGSSALRAGKTIPADDARNRFVDVVRLGMEFQAVLRSIPCSGPSG